MLKIICVLVAVAYYTIAERKVMAAIQRRRGPNVVGFWGLLQPVADGLKLVAKEMVVPGQSNSRIFVIAPLAILTLSLLPWGVLPFGCYEQIEPSRGVRPGFVNALALLDEISNISYGILLMLAISSLNVYSLAIAGWASNSKYAFLGALRSSAQMISYEVSMSLTVLPVVYLAQSLNFTAIVMAQAGTV